MSIQPPAPAYPILQLIDAEIEKQLTFGRRIIVAEGTHDVCSELPVVCADAIRAFVGRWSVRRLQPWPRNVLDHIQCGVPG